MFASIKSLTLLMLAHNDRWPFFAAVLWLAASLGVTVGVVFAAYWLCSSLGAPKWAEIIVLSSTLVPPMSFSFCAALLIYEPVWMALGFYRLLRIRPNMIRESVRGWATKASLGTPTP